MDLEEIIYPKNFVEGFGTTFSKEYLFGGNAVRWIMIPEGITCINAEAFAECTNLLDVIIPQSVVEIRDKAFANTSIFHLKLPNSLTYIGNDIVSKCSSLKSIEYPSNMVSLWGTVFDESWLWGNKYNLEQVSIPEGVTEIARETFYQCSQLEEVMIPNTVEIVGISAFEDCNKLETIVLPNSVHTIEAYAFRDCEKLIKVVLPGNYHTIKREAFHNCKKLVELENSFYTTHIETSAFESCNSLSEAQFLNVEKIEIYAFEYCSNLKIFAVSKKLKELDLYTFAYDLWPETFRLYENATDMENYKYFTSHHAFRNALGFDTPWYWD